MKEEVVRQQDSLKKWVLSGTVSTSLSLDPFQTGSKGDKSQCSTPPVRTRFLTQTHVCEIIDHETIRY